MSFAKTLRVEFRRLFTGAGFWAALLIFTYYNIKWFTGVLNQYAGKDIIDIPSAAMMFSQRETVAGLAIVGIAAIVCALPFAGSYISDLKAKMLSITFTRTKPAYYFSAKLTAAFCGTFLAILIPLLINQLLCCCFFEQSSALNDLSLTPAGGQGYYFQELASVPLPLLFDTHPYLYNMLFAVMFSAFFGLLSAAATGLSFIVNRFRLISFAAPYLFYMLMNFIDGYVNAGTERTMDQTNVALNSFLMVESYGLHYSWYVFVGEAAFLLVFSCAAAVYASRRDKMV